MAFFDFLSQPVGGYTGGSAAMQGPTMSGAALGASQGPTWGQLGQAAVQYGSPAGSRTPMYTGAAINALQNPQLMPMPEAQQKQAGMKEQDSLSQIVSLLASLFVGGV